VSIQQSKARSFTAASHVVSCRVISSLDITFLVSRNNQAATEYTKNWPLLNFQTILVTSRNHKTTKPSHHDTSHDVAVNALLAAYIVNTYHDRVRSRTVER